MSDSSTMDFSHIKYTHISPMARKLFSIEGIIRVFYGSNYISISKHEDEEWEVLKPDIYEVIGEHYMK